MPIYEYECVKCHQTTEALQKFSDPPLSNCPHCKGRLKKLMSLNSFHLKGSGWYVTDYAGKKPSGHGDKGPSDSGDKSDNAKASKSGKSKNSTESSTESSTKSGTQS